MLTQQDIHNLFDYDSQTGFLYWKKLPTKSYNTKVGDRAGYINQKTKKPHRRITIQGKTYYEHRIIYLYIHGVWPIDQVDHEDHDGANNTPDNLRDVPNRINGKNQKLHSHNTSEYCGVSWHKKNKKWIAYIRHDDIREYLGSFLRKIDAINARKEANIKYGFHQNHGRKTCQK